MEKWEQLKSLPWEAVIARLSKKNPRLEPLGYEWWSLVCPHPDHHTSTDTACRISRRTNILKCFNPACEFNTGVDVIDFAAIMLGLRREDGSPDRRRAARALAEMMGVPTPDNEEEEDPHREVDAARKEAVEAYHRCLRRSREAMEYLRSRGISGDLVDRFRVGYAPKDPERAFIVKHLRSQGFSNEIILQSGLACEDAGRLLDVLVDRITVPSFSDGRVAAICGRAIRSKDKRDKYRNVRGSVQGLWNFDQARRYREIILVEGVFDGMALVGMGYENTAALHGVSNAALAAQLIKRSNAKKVYLVLDADEGGREGALAIARHMEGIVEVRIVLLPDGQDPNDYCLSGGTREDFERRLQESYTPRQFAIVQELARRNPKTVADREEAVRAILPMLRSMDPMEIEVLADEVAQRLGISRNAVLGHLASRTAVLVAEARKEGKGIILVRREESYHALRAAGITNCLPFSSPSDPGWLLETGKKDFLVVAAPGEWTLGEAEVIARSLARMGLRARTCALDRPIAELVVRDGAGQAVQELLKKKATRGA